MKKFFMTFAAVAALFSFAACAPEDKPNSGNGTDPNTPPAYGDDPIDHFDLKIDITYADDILNNFDITYDIASLGKSIASGAIDYAEGILEVTGIKEGKLDVNVTAKAKNGFPELKKKYKISNHYVAIVYSVSKNGVSNSIGGLDLERQISDYEVTLESEIADAIVTAEDNLKLEKTFTIELDSDGTYIAR